MKTTDKIELSGKVVSAVLTAIEFFLEELGDDVDEDHPQFKQFDTVRRLHKRLSKPAKTSKPKDGYAAMRMRDGG
jgi:hypothetical protein